MWGASRWVLPGGMRGPSLVLDWKGHQRLRSVLKRRSAGSTGCAENGPDRQAQRDDYRGRDWQTRAGDVATAHPQATHGHLLHIRCQVGANLIEQTEEWAVARSLHDAATRMRDQRTKRPRGGPWIAGAPRHSDPFFLT